MPLPRTPLPQRSLIKALKYWRNTRDTKWGVFRVVWPVLRFWTIFGHCGLQVMVHGNKVVRLTILGHNGHGILIALLHVSWIILVSWWQNYRDACCRMLLLFLVLIFAERGHAIHGTNAHATVSDFSWDTEAFGVQSWPTDPQHTTVSTCCFPELGWSQHEWAVYMRKTLSWRFHADHPLGVVAVYYGAIPVGRKDGLTDMTWGQD